MNISGVRTLSKTFEMKRLQLFIDRVAALHNSVSSLADASSNLASVPGEAAGLNRPEEPEETILRPDAPRAISVSQEHRPGKTRRGLNRK